MVGKKANGFQEADSASDSTPDPCNALDASLSTSFSNMLPVGVKPEERRTPRATPTLMLDL